MSAWTSIRRGLEPSKMRLRIEPILSSWRFFRSSSDGFGHSLSPSEVILKIPISEVDPKRFLDVRRILSS